MNPTSTLMTILRLAGITTVFEKNIQLRSSVEFVIMNIACNFWLNGVSVKPNLKNCCFGLAPTVFAPLLADFRSNQLLPVCPDHPVT